MKKFNLTIFLSVTILCGLLAIPAFAAAFAADEGTLGDGVVWMLFAKLFYLFALPALPILNATHSMNGTTFFLGLAIDCLFYGIITERIVTLWSRWRVRKQFVTA